MAKFGVFLDSRPRFRGDRPSREPKSLGSFLAKPGGLFGKAWGFSGFPLSRELKSLGGFLAKSGGLFWIPTFAGAKKPGRFFGKAWGAFWQSLGGFLAKLGGLFGKFGVFLDSRFRGDRPSREPKSLGSFSGFPLSRE